ncbi:hypothetical protein EW146_g9156 [Bondarzewia mesenterica]|uniref:Uncharacterized protein n=1 Tax=Bondarzewia mesenterica TaxID=1095465 RepID=A0A4S4LA51_9AGAM|nr:hypothetical protein EW146_g9156 [Bondarzewia mesenterica]
MPKRYQRDCGDDGQLASIEIGDDKGIEKKRQRKGASSTLGYDVVRPSDQDLQHLLDFSSTSLTSSSAITSRFDEIASYLLHHARLICQTYLPDKSCSDSKSIDGTSTSTIIEEYEILEVEFYLIKTGIHEDPFTHGNEEQRTSGQWYFHRAPRPSAASPSYSASTNATSAGGYRGGTRKGLDLTLGTRASADPPVTSRFFSKASQSSTMALADNIRGGVLLRSIRRVSDSHVVSGPSLLVDELLRVNNAPSIVDLVRTKWCGDISIFPSPNSSPSVGKSVSLFLKLAKRQGTGSLDAPHIFKSPRIGLDLSNPSTQLTSTDRRILYVSKPYRYFIHPHLLTSNGRGQTFLGIYEHLHTSGCFEEDEDIVEEIVGLTGMKTKSVVKYISDYNAGRASGHLRSFVGPSGKGAAASPASYLRMIGSLHRFLSPTA